MAEPVRVGIIGTGKAAAMHADVLAKMKECRLVAAYGRTPDRVAKFAAQFGIHGHNDITGMVKQEQLEAVVVCTPHPQHTLAIQAMEAGAHALIEKPFASTLEDCDAMIKCAAQTKRKLGVISQRRFYPAVQRMKKAIADGKIGRPMLGVVSLLGWRDERYYQSDPWRGSWQGEGGGVLINQAPHLLDLFLWMMQDEVVELYGTWRNINHPYIEVEDTAVATLKFKHGGIGSVVLSNSQRPGIHGTVHVHGSSGASVGVQSEGGAMFIAGVSTKIETPFNDLWTIPEERELPDLWRAQDEVHFKDLNLIEYFIDLQDRNFLESLSSSAQPVISAKEGRRVVEVIEAWYQSEKTGMPVKLPL